jgi:hypothetical protein
MTSPHMNGHAYRGKAGAAPAGSKPPAAEIRCLADVKPEPICWLWPGRFALGKPNMLVGQPGLGKSLMAALMASTVSTGARWPDGAVSQKGNVLLVSCEDDAADTIAPRLDAAGADRQKIHLLDWIVTTDEMGQQTRRSLDIGRDVEALREAAERIGNVRLIIIDPISAYLGAADSHKTSDVRAALAPMQTLAAEIGACIVLISHLNKGATDASAMARVSGSGAFVAAARSAWLVGHHPRDESRRVLIPLKNNIGNDREGFAYWIEGVDLDGGIATSRVKFDADPIDLSAEEVLSAAPGGSEEGSARAEAERFLRDELAAGERTVAYLKAAAERAGIAWRTVQRAKPRVGVRAEKPKNEPHAGWVWRRPAETQERQGRHETGTKNLGGVGPGVQERQVLPSEILGGFGALGSLESGDHDGEVF